MIDVTASAREFIEARQAEDPGREWYLMIEWRLGEMENSRSADGSSIWRRDPDVGWTVELVGYGPEVDLAPSESLVPGVRVFVAPSNERSFPGGTVTFENGWLQVLPHAV